MYEDRDLDRRGGLTGPWGRFAFLLSLWMSLATAIVCAVVPAGLPLTRATGSAFDPSTTIVAIRARPPALVKLALLRVGEGDGAGIGARPAALVAPSPLLTAGVAILGLAPDHVPAALSLLHRGLPVALCARPPPAA